MPRHARSLLLVTLWALTSGCYKWVDIKPVELTKLNGSYSQATGTVPTPNGMVSTVQRTVAHVERPDGTLVEISGHFDADVSTNGGPTRFTHPVNSTVDSGQLAVRGGNRPLTTFPLQDVTMVRVSQPDVTTTVVAGVVLGGVTAAAFFLFLRSAAAP